MKREHADRLIKIVGKSAQSGWITEGEAQLIIKALEADQVPAKKKSVSPKKGT